MFTRVFPDVHRRQQNFSKRNVDREKANFNQGLPTVTKTIATVGPINSASHRTNLLAPPTTFSQSNAGPGSTLFV